MLSYFNFYYGYYSEIHINALNTEEETKKKKCAL